MSKIVLKGDVPCTSQFIRHLRLVEEVKDICGVALENEDVYMNTTFEDFTNQVVVKGRGGGAEEKDVEFDKVSVVVFWMSCTCVILVMAGLFTSD